MTPQEIVSELDRFIIGQKGAKRAVAIALRNRWRRQQVDAKLRPEITPKNILMIGPTGVGKTEIARRLAALADAPFIKVEATKYTEVGYVGKDVDGIIRDLVEIAIKQTREVEMRNQRARAEDAAEERILDVLVPPPRSAPGEPPALWRRQHRAPGVSQEAARRSAGRPRDRGRSGRAPADHGHHGPGRHGGHGRAVARHVQPDGAGQAPQAQAADCRSLEAADRRRGWQAGQRRRDQDARLQNAEQNGIVFIDEIDKVASRNEARRCRGVAPRGAARLAAAGGGHHRVHQARHAQDRSHPVHCQRCVSPGQTQ